MNWEEMNNMQIKFCIDILKSRKIVVKAQRKTNKKIFIEENDTDSVSQLKGKIKNLERKLEARKKRRVRKCRKDF